MTESDFYCKLNGWRKKDLRDWEKTRFVAWITQLSFGGGEKDFNNFFPIGEEKEEMTEDDMLAVWEEHKKYMTNAD